MTSTDTTLFPFPHWLNGEMRPGSVLDWPSRCHTCAHQACKAARSKGLQLCSYGYNFITVNDSMTVAGVLVREFTSTSKARGKLMKSERHTVISKSMVESSIQAVQSLEQSIHDAIESRKAATIDEYVTREQYKPDFLRPLRDEIQKGLSFVHDYKQVNTQISQNINVIVESRYTGADFDEKIEQATREERAIYEASKFLDEKLNVAKFLMHPEWLDLRDGCTRFRFHGVVLKYRRIYSPRFEAKGLDVRMQGQSYAEVVANPQASSIIPHTFIDNAAKYSPKAGQVEIFTDDRDGEILFAVSSFGPRILPGEEKKIFQPFYRGEAAERIEEEGAGYGLYLSQMIATRHFGTEIAVEQESRQTSGKGHWTTFEVTIPLQATVVV